MKLTSFATVLAIVCAPVLAHADDHAPPKAENPTYRSENTALALSAAGTVASVAMVGIGIGADNGQLAGVGLVSSLVTPSLGHWYAGDWLTAGMGLRALGMGVSAVGLVSELGCWENCQEDDRTSEVLIGIGLTSYLAGTIYDIATAPKAVREHNARFRITSVAPTTLQSTNSQVVMGMGIGGTF